LAAAATVVGLCDLEAPHYLESADSKEFGVIGMRHTVLLCRAVANLYLWLC
jgi:hypothetical protein